MRNTFLLLLCAVVLASCASQAHELDHNHNAMCGPFDASVSDGGVVSDASVPKDSGILEAGTDASAPDAARADSGTDAGIRDAGTAVDSGQDAATDAGLAYVPCSGTITASDDFERETLGVDWKIHFPSNVSLVGLIGGHDLGMMPGPRSFFFVDYRAVVFEPDQFCEATIAEDAPADWGLQVFVRRDGTGARYGFGYNLDTLAGPEGWYFKLDGLASNATRQFATVPGEPPSPGDLLCVEIRGYTMAGYRNGELMLTAEDTGPNRPAIGRMGLAARLASGASSTLVEQTPIWASWRGGSLDAL